MHNYIKEQAEIAQKLGQDNDIVARFRKYFENPDMSVDDLRGTLLDMAKNIVSGQPNSLPKQNQQGAPSPLIPHSQDKRQSLNGSKDQEPEDKQKNGMGSK